MFWFAGAGEVFASIEGPRGELSCYLSSDGGNKPHRVHMRTPSLMHLGALSKMSEKAMIADLIGIVGSIDITLGDSDR